MDESQALARIADLDKNNKLITITDGVPVADSRAMAETIGIEHRSFFRMILEYQQEIEEDFGKVRFEVTPSGKTKQPQKYAMLTEHQAYAYMTYSQNSDQARACKRSLVKGFMEAKQLLREVIPALARSITGFSADLNPYLGLTELDKINALDKLARSVRNLEYATHESEAHLQMKTLLFHIFGIMNSSHIPETYLDQLLIEVMKMRADAADERKYNNLMNSPIPPEIHNLVYRVLAPIIRDWQRRGKKV